MLISWSSWSSSSWACCCLGIFSYNGLVRVKNRVESAWAQIEVQLNRRHDLIPNLVETVKGYAAHEQATLENVIAARNRAVAAGSPSEQARPSRPSAAPWQTCSP